MVINNNLKDDNSDNVPGSESSKQSCVAWFKLAELITRKEKEKALSLYRLLSHSFDDKAYALQVEGDILWSLEDAEALHRYTQAAYLYKKEKNIIAAIGIYEHLLVLQPNDYECLSKIIVLYILLSWREQFEEKYLYALELLDKDIIKVEQVFDLSKRIIDFLTGVDRINMTEIQGFIDQKDPKKEFLWILSSFPSILKIKYPDLHKNIKEYCLEFDLDFNS